MSIYQNIFHYYRGQTRGNTDDIRQLQIENNVTKAFLNTLQHSSLELTSRFLNFINLPALEAKEYDYRYQVPNRMEKATKVSAVVGIAESKEIRKGTKKSYSIPDAAILSQDHTILIENKIGYTSYLEQYQLDGHQHVFALGSDPVHAPIILTWKEVRDFLKKEYSYFKLKQDEVTCFLLNQFEEFCTINCIGDRQKSKEYFFLNFEKSHAQKLAREIDDYIWGNLSNIEDAGTKDGIGYRKYNRSKLATLTTARQRCLILHIGNKEEKLGLSIQLEIDHTLGREFPRKAYEYDKYPHEAYIRLEWVDSLDQILPFLIKAYNSK